ncbi:TonB-dependent receptor [Aurantivibrio infirmus]
MKIKYPCILTSTCLLATMVPTVVNAQTSQMLEEIVVTAERREQSLQDVPLSITAFGSETRDRVGILSIQDMAEFTPGLSYNTSNDRPSIRGIGRQSNTFSLDSPVANYMDGVYTSSVQDAQRRPLFVDRTEILRGPQGALSGRGSVAGAINTFSKRPENEFGLEVRAYGGSYSRYGVDATVTGPITDWLRYRVNVASSNQDDGYFDNVANGNTEGDQPNNRQTADYLFEVDITEDIDLFVKASFTEYDETRRSGGSEAPYVADVIGAPPNAYGYLGSPLTPTAYFGYFDPTATQVGNFTENPVIVTGDRRKFSNNYQANQRLDDHHNYTTHLTWRNDLFDVKWIAGHQNYRYTQHTDGDGTAITSMTLPNFGAGRVVDPSAINTYIEQRQWYSNEITLTSNSDGMFNWIAGIYQSREDYNQTPFTVTHAGYDELATPTGAPVNQHGNASVYGELDGDTISSAIFGQVDFQVLDTLKFTLGLRQNKDEKEVREQTRYVANNVGFGPFLAGGAFAPAPSSTDVTPTPVPGDPLPVGVAADYGIDPVSGNRIRDLEGDWSATAGSIGIDFTPGDDNLIYLRIAKGYRPGGFNSGFLASVPQVEEETVLSYEIGYKGTIADQLQLSSSMFYYDFEDQQLSLPALGRCTNPADLSTCTVVANFLNVPKSESFGVELEMTWFPIDNLSLMLNYGYLDATIKDGLVNGTGFQNPDDPAAFLPNATRTTQLVGQTDAGYTEGDRWLQDISGNKVSGAPEHKAAFNVSYVFGLDAGDFTISSNYVWRDDSFSDVFETKPGIIDGYGTFGLRMLWTDSEDRYTVILSGTNLTDEDARDSGGVTRLATTASGAAGQQHFQTFNLIPPRQYSLEFQYRF